jgi:hypothetical protein
MMIDKRLQVSSQQALTGTSLVRSTDTIDLGSPRNIGPGEPIWLVVAARVGLAGTDTPTIKWSIQCDDASNFPSAKTLCEQPALGAAEFATGKLFALAVPMSGVERHLSVAFTMTGTTPTATVDAWFTNQDPTTWAALPDAI